MANPTLWEKLAEMDEDLKRGNANNSVELDVYVDSEWTNSAREEVDKWRHDADQWHGGETVG